MGNIRQFPTVLVLPGGGMRICSDREAEPIAMAYYAEGYSAFVLDYTTTTKKPDAVMAEPMEEVESSMRWIREHADDYALDPGCGKDPAKSDRLHYDPAQDGSLHTGI